MSVIIRLQNLPWSANALDIRQYFHGLSIPEGGVHIVGGEQGDAFIAFSTDEDARQAMLIDGGKIKEVKIKLFLSSRSEMQKVIEMARAQTLNLQSFMQMSAPPLLPQVSLVQGPVLPMLNQMPKVATPEIKPPIQQTLQQSSLPQPSPLQPQLLLPQHPVPQPILPQAINTNPSEKKNIPNQSFDVETKDLDSESVSSRDRRDRRDHQKSRSISKDRSRDHSRDRSKSRDRRDFRGRDRYRDRRKRDRSRSRDRRRRNRDRSRSRDRSSRKNSRERRKDSDKGTTGESDKNNATKKSPSIEKKIEPQPPLPGAQKPGFTSSGWVTVNENKPNVVQKPQPSSLIKPPVPTILSQTQKPLQTKNGINASADQDGKPQLSGAMNLYSMSNKQPNQLPENLLMSRQGPLLQKRTEMFPPIVGLSNKGDTPKQHLSQESWGINRPPLDINRPQLLDTEQMMPVNQFDNPAIDVDRRNALPPNNNFRVEDNLNRPGYMPHSGNEKFQSMFQNKPDMRMQNNFNSPIERTGFVPDSHPGERDGYRPGPLMNRPNFRQDPSSNFRPELQPNERAGFNRQEPLTERGNYRQEPFNDRGIHKQLPVNERGNQRQATPIERGNYRQNTQMERGNFRQEAEIERGNFRHEPNERSGHRPDRSFQSNDRFSQDERIERPERTERPSPYSQRQFNQRGKYNNSCVEVRNMSSSITYSDLRRFFHGLFIPGDGIKIINDCQGNRIGIAYIRFAKPYCKEQALKKNGHYIKNTMVEVLHINDDLFDKATDAPIFEGRNQLSENRGHYDSSASEAISTDEFLALAIREFPPFTKEKDIQNIFSSWKLADCFLLPKSGRRNASAYVKFFNMDDARKALAATSRYLIGNRKIHVSICYDHEFQDARDIKNMEDDEDDRLVIDTKDDNSAKITEARSPPKDPRIEAKANNVRFPEQKKESEPNKNEFQHLEQQQLGRTQPEPHMREPTVTETAQPEPMQIQPSQTDPRQSKSVQSQSEQKVSSQDFMEVEGNQPVAPGANFKFTENSNTARNSPAGTERQSPGPRILLPTPDKVNPSMPITEGETSMSPNEMPQRKMKNATDCIIMRGLPFQTNDRDILDFFADEEVIPTQIHIMLDKMGQPAGDAFCEFASTEEVEFALLKDNKPLGRSLVSVLPVTREEMCEAIGMASSPEHNIPPRPEFHPRPPHIIGRGGMRGRFRPNFMPQQYQNRLPPLMGYDHRRDMMVNQRREDEFDRGTSVDAFGRPGCVVALENVPFKADVDEIIDFFRGFDITRENVIRRYNEQGFATGDARVALASPQEAQRAVKVLSHKPIRNRQIFVYLLP